MQINLQGACTFRANYTDGPAANLYLYAPGVSVVEPTQAYATESGTTNTLTASPNSAGNWYLAIDHGISSTAYNLDSFKLTLETDSENPCYSFCSLIEYAVGMAPGLSNECICEQGFSWDSGN